MKSKKNLTRFTYDRTAFQGWRLCISRSGTTFSKYFSDKEYGSGRKSLTAAEKALKEIKDIVAKSRKVNGKLSDTTVKKVNKVLKNA